MPPLPLADIAGEGHQRQPVTILSLDRRENLGFPCDQDHVGYQQRPRWKPRGANHQPRGPRGRGGRPVAGDQPAAGPCYQLLPDLTPGTGPQQSSCPHPRQRPGHWGTAWPVGCDQPDRSLFQLVTLSHSC